MLGELMYMCVFFREFIDLKRRSQRTLFLVRQTGSDECVGVFFLCSSRLDPNLDVVQSLNRQTGNNLTQNVVRLAARCVWTLCCLRVSSLTW